MGRMISNEILYGGNWRGEEGYEGSSLWRDDEVVREERRRSAGGCWEEWQQVDVGRKGRQQVDVGRMDSRWMLGGRVAGGCSEDWRIVAVGLKVEGLDSWRIGGVVDM